MARKPRKCSVEGCEGRHVGRGYCMRHYQQMRYHGKLALIRPQRRPLPAGEQPLEPRDLTNYVMLSECCRAPVAEGEVHEYGKQYCETCGEGCLWRYHHVRDVQFT